VTAHALTISFGRDSTLRMRGLGSTMNII